MKNKLNIIIRFFKLNQLYMNSFGVGNMGKYVSSILGGIFIFIYFLFAGVDQFIVAFAISFGSYSFLHDIYTGKGHWYIDNIRIFIRIISYIICFCLVICLFVYLTMDIVYASTIEDIANSCNTGINNTPATQEGINTPISEIPEKEDKDTYKFSMEVDKKVANAVGEILRESISKVIDTGLSKIATGAGVGAAVGAVGAAVVKSNLPIGPKMGMLAACGAITAASVKVGMDVGTAIIEKRIRTDEELIKNDPDRAPSPGEGFNNILLGCFSSVKYKGLFIRKISSSPVSLSPQEPLGKERGVQHPSNIGSNTGSPCEKKGCFGEQDILELSISEIMKIYGSYDNYLKYINMEVDEDFMKKNYPEHIDDFKFRSLLSILNPIFISKVDMVNKVYTEINKYNELSSKFILYSEYLSKDLSQVLLGELKKSRSVLVSALKELGCFGGTGKDFYVEDLLNSLNKKVRNKILLESSVNFKGQRDKIEGDDYFISLWDQIKKIIHKDANIHLIEMAFLLNKDDLNNHIYNIKSVTIELYTLVSFMIEQNIPGLSDNWNGFLINDLEDFSSKEKMESYRTKHKGERKKRISLGQVMYGYNGIIMKYHNNCSDKILNFIIDDSKKLDKNELLDITKVVSEDMNKYQNKLYNDHKVLVNELNIIFDSYKLIYDLAKNFNTEHLKEKSEIFKDSILKSMGNKNHDELFRINKLILEFNKSDLNSKSFSKESLLTEKSYIFTKAKQILLEKGIDDENKQILLETFILNYEKDYVLNLIKNMDGDLSDFKLLTRIYKHSTPGYISRVEAFIKNNSIRGFELYNKDKDNLNKYGNQIALALFLLIKPEQLISIIFSKIIRLIGMSGGIKQTDFLDNLSKELIITLKYNYSKKENLDKLNPTEKNVVLSICNKLESITVDSKFQFGILIMEFIMSEFDYIFVKHNIYENKENHIFLNIKQEYLAILAGSVFNPIRLPMVAKPKKWLYFELLDGVLRLESSGGYYLDAFIKLSSSHNIIR